MNTATKNLTTREANQRRATPLPAGASLGEAAEALLVRFAAMANEAGVLEDGQWYCHGEETAPHDELLSRGLLTEEFGEYAYTFVERLTAKGRRLLARL